MTLPSLTRRALTLGAVSLSLAWAPDNCAEHAEVARLRSEQIAALSQDRPSEMRDSLP